MEIIALVNVKMGVDHALDATLVVILLVVVDALEKETQHALLVTHVSVVLVVNPALVVPVAVAVLPVVQVPVAGAEDVADVAPNVAAVV